jgi:hypothetical protein
VSPDHDPHDLELLAKEKSSRPTFLFPETNQCHGVRTVAYSPFLHSVAQNLRVPSSDGQGYMHIRGSGMSGTLDGSNFLWPSQIRSYRGQHAG